MNTRMRVAVALFAMAAAGLGACSKNKSVGKAEAFPDSLVIGEVVAIVGPDTITARELRVLAFTTTTASQDSLHSRSFNLMLLDQMIDRKLFAREAEVNGVSLPDSFVNRVMDQFVGRFGGQERTDATLKPLGFGREHVRDAIRRDMLIRAYVQQKVEPTITVSEADCEAFFDQNTPMFAGQDSVRVSHIIVMFHEEDTPEKKMERRSFIEGVRKRAAQGQDFARLATQFSEDAAASLGGDLGFFARGTMVKEFEDVAFSLKKGELTGIVETRFGYHIIKCTDKKAAAPANYATAKPQIETMLKQQQLSVDLQNRLKKNRDTAIIVRNYDTGA